MSEKHTTSINLNWTLSIINNRRETIEQNLMFDVYRNVVFSLSGAFMCIKCNTFDFAITCQSINFHCDVSFYRPFQSHVPIYACHTGRNANCHSVSIHATFGVSGIDLQTKGKTPKNLGKRMFKSLAQRTSIHLPHTLHRYRHDTRPPHLNIWIYFLKWMRNQFMAYKKFK